MLHEKVRYGEPLNEFEAFIVNAITSSPLMPPLEADSDSRAACKSPIPVSCRCMRIKHPTNLAPTLLHRTDALRACTLLPSCPPGLESIIFEKRCLGLVLISEQDFERNRVLGRGVEVWVPTHENYVPSVHESNVLYDMQLDFQAATSSKPADVQGVVGATSVRAHRKEDACDVCRHAAIVRIADPTALRRNRALQQLSVFARKKGSKTRSARGHDFKAPLQTLPISAMDTSSTVVNSVECDLQQRDSADSFGEADSSSSSCYGPGRGCGSSTCGDSEDTRSRPSQIDVMFCEDDGRVVDPAYSLSPSDNHSPSRPPRTQGTVFASHMPPGPSPYASDFLTEPPSGVGIASIPVGFSGERVRIYDMFDGISKSKRGREE